MLDGWPLDGWDFVGDTCRYLAEMCIGAQGLQRQSVPIALPLYLLGHLFDFHDTRTPSP